MDGYSVSQQQNPGHEILAVDWYAPSCEYRETCGKLCPKFLPHTLVDAKSERLMTEVNQYTAELLEGDHRLVPLLIVVHDDLLVTALTDDEACVTPTKVIHAPEGIDRKEKTVDGIPRTDCENLS